MSDYGQNTATMPLDREVLIDTETLPVGYDSTDWITSDFKIIERLVGFYKTNTITLSLIPATFQEADDGSISLGSEFQIAKSDSISNEAEDMCQKEGLSKYVQLLDRKIREIYHDVSHIRHRTLVLPDNPAQQRLRFEIHISSSTTQILADERKFHTEFFELVPEEKQEFFSFTYRVN